MLTRKVDRTEHSNREREREREGKGCVCVCVRERERERKRKIAYRNVCENKEISYQHVCVIVFGG